MTRVSDMYTSEKSNPMQIRNESPPTLEAAALAAVTASTQEMVRITTQVGLLMDSLRESAAEVRKSMAADDSNSPAGTFVNLLDDTAAKLLRLFEHQSAALPTFNIVLFGRTGAGKSTLISAMTRGNGESVSQGESDWTTKVEPLNWHSCRIYDTPGINGWGRSESRADLEERARKAVEVADFVLVCFDTQSQQEGEFNKLAAWVNTYRKPLIAVLNTRNQVWRLPSRVPVGSARSNLSNAVREHAMNIRDELSKAGLFEVPIVALSSKRALFARASLPFKGPDQNTLQAQRKQFGIERLEAWSGFPRLEKLLVQTVSSHAVALRLGALNDQLRAVLSELLRELQNFEVKAAQAAETVENLVCDLLKVLGYPPRDDEERRRPFKRSGRDILADLEHRRKGAFQAPVEGEFGQLVRQRLDTELGSLRSRSLIEAEECVLGAFDRGKSLSEEALRAVCFKDEELLRQAESVLKEAVQFLEKRVRLAQRDTTLDLKILSRGAAIKGNAGAGWKYSAWAAGAGKISFGLANVLGGLAGANIWNPFGWSAAVTLGLIAMSTAAGCLFGWIGSKTRNNAERTRLDARRQALAEVRRNIHEAYDKFRDAVMEEASKHAASASGELLTTPIEQALSLRGVQNQCKSLQNVINQLINGLPPTDDPQTLVWQTAIEVEIDAFPNDPNRSRKYWLGEDWITDPIGLTQETGTSNGTRTNAYDPSLIDHLFDGLTGIFRKITEKLKPGSGETWLCGALERCAGDVEALKSLAELQEIAADRRPRIHLVGDYNAGKSSFIKRLLLEAGSVAPPSLNIGANPTTDQARYYSWEGFCLVDNPGFQSGHLEHTEHALKSFPDASAIIYLFQPNLVLGDDVYLLKVLRGDEELGLVPKNDRTFFVINRSDELGVDPEVDPKTYNQLVKRKKEELSQALRSRGVEVESSTVFCMASDPFGMVGNRADVDASAFDPYRRWDGFKHLMSEIRRNKDSLLRSGSDRSVLDGGIARLTELAAQQRVEIDQLSAQDRALERLQMQIHEAIAEGTRLGQEHRNHLERLLMDHAAGFRDEVLSEENPDKLKHKIESFERWWTDKALEVELSRWQEKATDELNSWRARISEAIKRRLESAEFRAAFPDHEDAAPNITETHVGKSWFRHGFNTAGRTMGGATRDVVYSIGKMLGFKFRPWGAVNLAKTLGQVGVVMAVVGVGLDVIGILRDERKLAKREENRQKFANYLRESVSRVAETLAKGTEEEPGVLLHLDAMTKELREYEAAQAGERERLAAQIVSAKKRISTYEVLRTEAFDLIGDPWR